MEFLEWQREVIDEARVARLATIARDGRPAIVPVCYARLDKSFAIAIDEKPKTGRPLARLRNIERDPRVSLLIDHYDDQDWRRLAWVRIEGLAVVLDTGQMLPEALIGLRGRYRQYREMELETRPLIVITATRVVGWRWSEGDDLEEAAGERFAGF